MTIKSILKEIDRTGITWFIMVISLLILCLGVISNFHVIQTNEGRMPIPIETDNPNYVSFEDKSEINNYLLSDIIGFSRAYVSIGDLIMMFGLFLLIYAGARHGKIILKKKEGEKE